MQAETGLLWNSKLVHFLLYTWFLELLFWMQWMLLKLPVLYSCRKGATNKLLRVFGDCGQHGFVHPLNFPSVPALVEYYRDHSLAECNPNLDIKLLHPVPDPKKVWMLRHICMVHVKWSWQHKMYILLHPVLYNVKMKVFVLIQVQQITTFHCCFEAVNMRCRRVGSQPVFMQRPTLFWNWRSCDWSY